MGRLLEFIELGARGRNNAVRGHRGFTPESLDGALIAVGRDINVGVGPRLIVGQLDSHGLDVGRISHDASGGHKAEGNWNEPHFGSSGWKERCKMC